MTESTAFVEMKGYGEALIRFSSLHEIKTHVEAELTFLAGLNLPPSPMYRGGQEPIGHVNQLLSNIQSYIAQALSQESATGFDAENPPEAWKRAIADTKNGLHSLYVKSKYPYKTDVRRAALVKLCQQSPNGQFKRGLLESLIYLDSNNGELGDASRFPDIQAGRLVGWLIEHGIIPEGKIALEKAKTLLTLTTYYENARKELEDLIEKNSQQRSAADLAQSQFLEQTEKTVNTKIEEADKKLESFLEEQTKEIEHFKNAVQKELALQAPVKYWTDKKTRHENAQRTAYRWLCGLGVISAVGVALAGWKLVPFYGDIKNVNLLFSALVLVVITGMTWVVKTVMRVYLTNIHLMHDAEERLAMINSYLALMKTEHPLQGDSLAPVLTALFRPASDGIVKDEPLPLNLLELIRPGATK